MKGRPGSVTWGEGKIFSEGGQPVLQGSAYLMRKDPKHASVLYGHHNESFCSIWK